MDLTSDAIQKLLTLAEPNQIPQGDKLYVDKQMLLITPPAPTHILCSTLQGLVDLFSAGLEDANKTPADVLVHVASPINVQLIARKSDGYGRRQMFAQASYPVTKGFPFGQWTDPELFIILAQQYFQRVKLEHDDGTFAKDLDYVIQMASQITAESAVKNTDDGVAQRVEIRTGVVLKDETTLRPIVNLAPYRTFAEVDQVLGKFVFRARTGEGGAKLALFEADGGRWMLAAVAAIDAWLGDKFTGVSIIS